MAAVFSGSDHASDAGGGVSNQLFSVGIEEVLGTVVGGGLVQGLAQVPVAGLAVGAHSTRLGIGDKGDGVGVDAPALGEGVLAVFGGLGQSGYHLDSLGGGHLLDVINDLAGPFSPGADQIVVCGLLGP